jgi:hypothetical protein
MGFLPAAPVRIVGRMKGFSFLAAALLQGCVFLPRTETVYDQKCDVHVRQLTLEARALGQFPGSCSGKDCGYLLVALGVIAAGSAVISGSIVVVGNAVYWAERQCLVLGGISIPRDLAVSQSSRRYEKINACLPPVINRV